MFLSRAELMALTGYRRRAYVVRELRRRRYPFELGADGWPVVLAATVSDRLSTPNVTWVSPARRVAPQAPVRRPADPRL